MLTDLKCALRTLVKSPTFTIIAVLTLALGIGANTAIFSVVNGLLLRPLPYPESERLVTFKSGQSVPDLVGILEQSRSFETVGGVAPQAADYTGGGEPVQIEMGLVTGDFFHLLGANAALGRTITREDDRLGAARVVVLTYGLWQRQFGGDASVLGRNIMLAGESYTIIGVTPAGFHPPRRTMEAFAPVHVFYPLAATARGAHILRAYARLRPGVTLAQAQSEMRAIDQRLAAQFPEENKQRQSTLVTLHERIVGDVRPALLVLFGAVGLVLLIACANFANLLLARVAERTHELTIRAALGASRRRIVSQLLIESVALSLMGGAAGLLLGKWGIDALLALKPDNLPRVTDIHLDASVLGFTFALSLLTGIIFGLLPAWHATRVDLNGVLAAGNRRATPARTRTRSLLVVSELGLALVLLIGAGLLAKAFWRLTNIAPGFDPQSVLTMRVELPEARYREVQQQTQFRERVLERVNALPGLSAAMVSELPLGGEALNHNFIIDGRPPASTGEEPELYSRSIAGDYFRVLSIPLKQGRAFTAQDRAGAPLVGIINESMARQYFHGENPLGARIRWARSKEIQWITIVGIVGDVRHFGLAQTEEPAIYTPYQQSLQAWKRWSEIVVRAEQNAAVANLAVEAKKQVWTVDSQIPVTKIRSMSEVMAGSLAERRFNTLLLGILAGVALALAIVGLYGVLAYSVVQRTHEIGVRMAIGAQARDVLGLVLRQGLKLALGGVAVGIVASLAGTRILRGLLYGVGPTDPTTFAAVATLLVMVALAACYFPARRATRIDPIQALRYE